MKKKNIYIYKLDDAKQLGQTIGLSEARNIVSLVIFFNRSSFQQLAVCAAVSFSVSTMESFRGFWRNPFAVEVESNEKFDRRGFLSAWQ